MSFYENHLFDKELPVIFHLDNLENPEKKSCLSNWHENIELIYCVEGKGSAVINSDHIELSQGSVLVINSGDIHYIVSETPKMRYYCLIIYSDFLKAFGMDVENVFFCKNVTDACGKEFFEKIVEEFAGKPPFYQTIVKGYIVSYMGYLCRNYTCEKSGHGDNSRIKQGLTYIREHFTEDLSVEQIAFHAGFSRYYFSRQFKNVTGMTVMKYVEFLRCRYARELLEGGASVSKAAMECGFGDLSYFTKVFKRQHGVLPSKIHA